jgi:hypothetical protein
MHSSNHVHQRRRYSGMCVLPDKFEMCVASGARAQTIYAAVCIGDSRRWVRRSDIAALRM